MSNHFWLVNFGGLVLDGEKFWLHHTVLLIIDFNIFDKASLLGI